MSFSHKGGNPPGSGTHRDRTIPLISHFRECGSGGEENSFPAHVGLHLWFCQASGVDQGHIQTSVPESLLDELRFRALGIERGNEEDRHVRKSSKGSGLDSLPRAWRNFHDARVWMDSRGAFKLLPP